jgi:hypothetical protein
LETGLSANITRRPDVGTISTSAESIPSDDRARLTLIGDGPSLGPRLELRQLEGVGCVSLPL